MATELAGSRWPLILLNREYKPCHPVSSLFHGDPNQPSKLWANSRVGRICSTGHGEKEPSPFGSRNALKNLDVKEENLKPLWEDGFGIQTAKDYLEAVKYMIQDDRGPPRWFCPIEAGPPLKNSPVLLYLPGMDGLGMGMILHHKPLGKVFEVRCMYIPIHNRTPYEGLVRFVEYTVRAEHESHPNRPIYLVGDSFGGCLALSVAAANPTIDFVMILVNPATSFNRSSLQALIPFLEVLPDELDGILPYLFGTTFANLIKMANVINARNPVGSPVKQLEKLTRELSVLLQESHSLPDVLPKQSLIWKLNLLKTAAAHSNSRLHAVRAQAIVLASGRDSVLPSKLEARRLSGSLKDCRVRFFPNNGHPLLLEDGIHLLSVIKGLCMYRRSNKRDYISDFLPPSMSEYEHIFDQELALYRIILSPVMLSTLPDGKIVRGLTGVPQQGPVLLVGYHMLIGTELCCIMDEFLREKKVLVHGLAHPEIFGRNVERTLQEVSTFDYFKIFGATPITPKNLFKLLRTNSHVLLYPGGVREALHRKGEQYKLFWPNKPEFVRMVIKLGATIVPFGAVGEDDLLEQVLDYNDLMKIPILKDIVKSQNQSADKIKAKIQSKGETASQSLYFPGFYPKVPGRFYYLFGKPVETKGKKELLEDDMKVNEFYQQIKSNVEENMAYLLKKREEDPYRPLFERVFHRTITAPTYQIPSFDP